MVDLIKLQKSDKYVLKKYDGRKLYDLMEKRFITLLEVSQKIAKGKNIYVFDNNDDSNITVELLNEVYSKKIRDLIVKASKQKRANIELVLNEAIRKL